MSIPTYQFILPNLTKLRVADQITAVFKNQNITLPRYGGPAVVSPHFTEPSLVYRLGSSIDVTDKADLMDMENFSKGRVIILDKNRKGTKALIEDIQNAASKIQLCMKTTPSFEGFNYSKGDEVDITIVRAVQCSSSGVSGQSQPRE